MITLKICVIANVSLSYKGFNSCKGRIEQVPFVLLELPHIGMVIILCFNYSFKCLKLCINTGRNGAIFFCELLYYFVAMNTLGFLSSSWKIRS